MSKIRTEISIESSESFIIRRKRYSVRGWCETCAKTAIFVLPTEASFLAGLDPDIIVSLVYNGKLHVCEFPGRGIYVCLTSLCLHGQDSKRSEPEIIQELRLSGSESTLKRQI